MTHSSPGSDTGGFFYLPLVTRLLPGNVDRRGKSLRLVGCVNEVTHRRWVSPAKDAPKKREVQQ
ncbi:hypothetical protein [Microseira sp. BLCC-F43]|uniref:hypothetical protein n=1 Tax=Microseira sp. BLCC-F43 TaxID=3153602 RepID=UPI0035B7384B